MELPDTSIWIDHFRRNDAVVQALLFQEQIVIHPYVIGELAMGQLRPRADALAALLSLPKVEIADPNDVLSFVEEKAIFGIGVGYVDAHLLYAAYHRRGGTVLWTRDKRLKAAALRLGIASRHA